MNRTHRLAAGGLAALLMVCSSCGSRKESPSGPPNVVLITLDTLRPDHLGCYGHPSVQTPHLDRLAEKSARFEQAITVVPTTLASHLSILTGTGPRTHGIARNGFRAHDGNLSLAEILQDRGYATAAFVSAFSLDRQFNLTQGFDHYDCSYDASMTPNLADQAQRRAGATTDAALEWMKGHQEDPFFLWVHYFDPHYPYDPPGRYETLYDPDYRGTANGSMRYMMGVWQKRVFPSRRDREHIVSLYDGEISYMDEHLGRLFKMLEKSGLMDHSIVVVVADHGESLGEHGYDFDHGLYVYDASIRVPLLVYVPALTEGRVIPQQVETLDILPTVLDLLGIPIPGPVEGQSLRPLLEGSTEWAERTVFSEASKPWNVEGESDEVFRNDWKAKCARTREWKYIHTPFAKTRELYRLTQDPGEITNLLGKEPGVAQDLQGILQAWAEQPRERHSTVNLADQDPETLEKLRSLGYLQ